MNLHDIITKSYARFMVRGPKRNIRWALFCYDLLADRSFYARSKIPHDQNGERRREILEKEFKRLKLQKDIPVLGEEELVFVYKTTESMPKLSSCSEVSGYYITKLLEKSIKNHACEEIEFRPRTRPPYFLYFSDPLPNYQWKLIVHGQVGPYSYKNMTNVEADIDRAGAMPDLEGDKWIAGQGSFSGLKKCSFKIEGDVKEDAFSEISGCRFDVNGKAPIKDTIKNNQIYASEPFQPQPFKKKEDDHS